MTKTAVIKIRGKIPRPTFALLLGISPITLWKWETGRTKPEAASVTLLELLKEHPREILAFLRKRQAKRFGGYGG